MAYLCFALRCVGSSLNQVNLIVTLSNLGIKP